MTTPNRLPLSQFLETIGKRLFIDIWARTGEGKSYFPLSFPKPMYIFNFEPEGPSAALTTAIRQGVLRPDDEVYILDPLTEGIGASNSIIRTLKEDRLIYEWTQDNLHDIVQNGNIGSGTIVMDTMSTFYTILRECEMEEITELRRQQGKDKPYQFDFGAPNKALRNMMDGLRSGTLFNLITLNHSSPIFNSKGQATGRHQYGGPNRLVQWVDVHGRLSYEPLSELEPTDGTNWTLTFEKCRNNINLVDKLLPNPTYDRLVRALNGEEGLVE